MSKIIIDDLLDETSFLNDANERFQQIADEFNNKVLYRDNPVLEPNAMQNDLDMNGNDILNAKTVTMDSAIIGGKPFNPEAETFVPYTVYTPEQDAQNVAILALEATKAEHLSVSEVRETDLALSLNQTGTDYSLELTPNTNKSFGGLVQLNAIGKVPNELILASITNIKGFWEGQDSCPKILDGILTPVNPDPCPIAGDFRNPNELYLDYVENITYQEGDMYILSFDDASAGVGNINLIDQTAPLDGHVKTEVNQGDVIIYLEAKTDDSGTPLSGEGWYLWAGAVNTGSATSTLTETADFNNVLSSADVNVQRALDTIDNNAITPAQQTAALALLEADISQNTTDIGVNAGIISSNTTAIGLNSGLIDDNALAISGNDTELANHETRIGNNETAIATKIGRGDYATEDGAQAGTLRVRYTASNNLLEIFTTD